LLWMWQVIKCIAAQHISMGMYYRMAGTLIWRELRNRYLCGIQFSRTLENIGVKSELTGSGSKGNFAEAVPWTKEKLAPWFCAS
jgi:hypothetical protein